MRLMLVALFCTGNRQAEAVNVTNNVSPSGTSAVIINGQNNPTLTLTRGVTYVFVLSGLSIHPFHIKTNLTTGTGGSNVFELRKGGDLDVMKATGGSPARFSKLAVTVNVRPRICF